MNAMLEPEPEPTNLTVGFLVKTLMAQINAEQSPTSASSYKRIAKLCLLDWGEDTLLQDITRRRVQAWINRRRTEAKPSYIHGQTSFLSRIFRLAREDYGSDLPNVARGCRMPTINNKRERILTEDEEKRLGAVMPRTYWFIAVFAVHTGMRRLEIFRLKPKDIRLFERDGQLVGLAQIATSKTGKGRQCPLNPMAAAIAKDCIERGGEYLFELPRARTEDRFHTGIRYTASFRVYCRKAGIVGLTFHSLRHTAASRALEAGVRLEDIKLLLGHSSIIMTERYSHHTTEQLWPAAMAICDGRATTPPVTVAPAAQDVGFASLVAAQSTMIAQLTAMVENLTAKLSAQG